MKRRLLIFTVLLAGALLRGQDLTKAWIGNHAAWGGAMYGHIAHNYVKFGYGATRLGPVSNAGDAEPHEFEFYYHYPCMLVWSVSVAFHLLGVSEWAARLVPLLFSLGILWLVYAVGRKLYDERTALLALVLATFFPVETYYGSHVDVYGPQAVFFTLWAFYGYVRWLDGYRRRDLAICLVGAALGCWTAWYTYFLVPLLLLHAYLFRWRRGERRVATLWWLPTCCIIVFGLFVLHRRVLLQGAHAEIHGGLIEKLLIRMSYNNLLTASGEELTPLSFGFHHFKDFARMYSPLVVLLMLAWIAGCLSRVVRRRAGEADWLMLVLFGYGFLHNAVFPAVVSGHDYLVRCDSPAVAISAAVMLLRLLASLKSRSVRLPRAFPPACVLILVANEIYFSQRLFEWGVADAQRRKELGITIHEATGGRDLVLTPLKSDQVITYYADRRITFGRTTADDLRLSCAADEGGCFYAFPTDRIKLPDDILELLKTGEVRAAGDTTVIQLPSSGK